MNHDAEEAKKQGRRLATIGLALVIIGTSFVNIYKFAQKAQPGNTVIAAITLCAGGCLLGFQFLKQKN